MPAAAAVRRHIRVKMWPESGKTAKEVRLPGVEGADAAGPVSTAEVSPLEMLVGRGACCVTVVAAAGASAEPLPEPLPPPKGTTKTKAKAVLTVGEPPPAITVIAGGDRSRYTSDESPQRSRNAVNPHAWLVYAKVAKIRRGGRQPNHDGAIGAGHQRGTSPLKPTRGVGEERSVLLRAPVNGIKKSALPLPLRYSIAYSNAARTSNHH